MNLRDAMDRVEREQPQLTGTAKMQAIKAMRAQPKPAEADPQEQTPRSVEAESEKPARKPTSVGEAWGFLAFVVVAMQLIPWIAWGSLTAEPHWYDALHAVLLAGATVELISAYRRRSS